MKNPIVLIYLFLIIAFDSYSQLKFDPFFEIKAQGELNLRCFKSSNVSNLRLMFTAGNRIKLFNYPKNQYYSEFLLDSGKAITFIPVFSLNMLVGKGLGASMFDTDRRKYRLTLVSGYNLLFEGGINKYYHQVQSFSPLVSAPIISKKSTVVNISANTVHIFKFSRQFVGGAFLGIRKLSGSYHNDGPPFNILSLGDGFDRMFTGSGSLAINMMSNRMLEDKYSHIILNPNFDQRILRFGYERYTGYEKNKYEIAQKLKLDAVEYNNFRTNGYNRGLLKIEYLTNKISAGIQLNDFDDLDVQNIIHIIRKEPFHRTINRHSFSVIGSWYNTNINKNELVNFLNFSKNE